MVYVSFVNVQGGGRNISKGGPMLPPPTTPKYSPASNTITLTKSDHYCQGKTTLRVPYRLDTQGFC